MSGFAAIIDWREPIYRHQVDAMMSLVPYRSTAGRWIHATPHAVLAEGRTSHDGSTQEGIATLGPLSIVGDIRLFRTDGLRTAAGGINAASGLDDRQLILSAFRRRGLDMLDALDGDFAFVIWDDDERRVVAVRDRFGVKPLFFEATPAGLRFASEVKQLAATSERSPTPEPRSVAEFLTYTFTETRRTFFAGIDRVRPSHLIEATEPVIRDRNYWDPEPTTVRHDPSALPVLFREQVVAAVDRRLRTSPITVGQLSGGLDSSSVAASAAILASRGSPAEFITASAVYDLPSVDESQWIDDIVAMQPFPHHDFTPVAPDMAAFEADMWVADGPFIDLIRDMNHATASIASDAGAGLVLTGDGGDRARRPVAIPGGHAAIVEAPTLHA